MSKRRSWRFWLGLLALLAVGIGVGWILATAIHASSLSSSSSTTKSTPPPNQTFTVTIPPDSTNPGREVGVTIPGPLLDKLGPPPDTSWPKVFENIWPGLSTLFGALVGGGVTLAVGLLNNWHQNRASKDARQGVIRDRSFEACVDILKAGRLATAAASALWYQIYRRASDDQIVGLKAKLDKTVRDLYVVGEVVRLTVPPEANLAFDDYWTTLRDYINAVQGWQIEYLASTSSDTGSVSKTESELKGGLDEARYAEFDRLEDSLLAKRDVFIDVAKTQFDYGTWSNV